MEYAVWNVCRNHTGLLAWVRGVSPTLAGRSCEGVPSIRSLLLIYLRVSSYQLWIHLYAPPLLCCMHLVWCSESQFLCHHHVLGLAEKCKKAYTSQSSTATSIVKSRSTSFSMKTFCTRKGMHPYDSLIQGLPSSQRNGYDCRIFALAMVLHLAEWIDI